jgi:hypothetical protein
VSVTYPLLPPAELIGYVGHHDRTSQVDILRLRPRTEWGEGLVAMRKRNVKVTPEELGRVAERRRVADTAR